MDGLTGNVGRIGRGQKGDRVGDILDATQPAQGDLLQQRLALLFRQRPCHVGVDESRRNGIYRDTAGPNLPERKLRIE